MRKQMNYAEHQYKKAYSILREADHTQVGCEHYLYLHELLDFEIEESYVGKAIKSQVMRFDRVLGGVAWWADVAYKRAWIKEDAPLWNKISRHVSNYFLPF